MFEDFGRKSIEELRAETEANNKKKEAEGAALEMVAEILLKSNMSEDLKDKLRVSYISNKIHRILNDLVCRYGDPDSKESPEDIRAAVEYLALVKLGLEQYMETALHREGQMNES